MLANPGQSTIRKSMPSGHDPMGGHRFSLATNAKRLRAEIILKQEDRAGRRIEENSSALIPRV